MCCCVQGSFGFPSAKALARLGRFLQAGDIRKQAAALKVRLEFLGGNWCEFEKQEGLDATGDWETPGELTLSVFLVGKRKEVTEDGNEITIQSWSTTRGCQGKLKIVSVTFELRQGCPQ
jgi:hypothetical protein